MTEKEQQLERSLQDVRRAYRLVYAYQRRLFDLISVVASALEGEGLKFEAWRPTLFKGPPQANKPFYKDHWAWDFLPGYIVRLRFQRENAGNRPALCVWIETWSDSGAERGFADQAGEPDPGRFKSEDQCDSVVTIDVLRAKSENSGGFWFDAWRALCERDSDALFDGKPRAINLGGTDVEHRHLEVPIWRLGNREAVQVSLIDPLIAYLRSELVVPGEAAPEVGPKGSLREAQLDDEVASTEASAPDEDVEEPLPRPHR